MSHAAPRILTATSHASMGVRGQTAGRDSINYLFVNLTTEIYECHMAGVQSGIFLLLKVLTDVTGPGSPLITNLTCPAEGSVYLEWTKPEVTNNFILILTCTVHLFNLSVLNLYLFKGSRRAMFHTSQKLVFLKYAFPSFIFTFSTYNRK